MSKIFFVACSALSALSNGSDDFGSGLVCDSGAGQVETGSGRAAMIQRTVARHRSATVQLVVSPGQHSSPRWAEVRRRHFKHISEQILLQNGTEANTSNVSATLSGEVHDSISMAKVTERNGFLPETPAAAYDRAFLRTKTAQADAQSFDYDDHNAGLNNASAQDLSNVFGRTIAANIKGLNSASSEELFNVSGHSMPSTDGDMGKVMPSTDADTDEADAKRRRRNMFLVGGSAIVPIALLLLASCGKSEDSGGNSDEEPDDYWAGPIR